MNQDYEVMDKMGQGNAAVFVVTHKKFKERGDCAMKLLSYNDSTVKEVRLQMLLKHQYIVYTYDAFIAEDRQ